MILRRVMMYLVMSTIMFSLGTITSPRGSSSDLWLEEKGMTKDFRCLVDVVDGYACFSIVNVTEKPIALRRGKWGFNYLIQYVDEQGRHRELERNVTIHEHHIDRLEVLHGQPRKDIVLDGCRTTAEYKVKLPIDFRKFTVAVLELSYLTLQEIGDCYEIGDLELLLSKRTFRVKCELQKNCDNVEASGTNDLALSITQGFSL